MQPEFHGFAGKGLSTISTPRTVDLPLLLISTLFLKVGWCSALPPPMSGQRQMA